MPWALPGMYDDRIVGRTHDADWSRAAAADIEARSADVRARYPQVSVDIKVVHGHPAPALVEEATEGDLIVLARRTHGYPPATHLGTAARGVLHRAACPVLVVPPLPVAAGSEPRAQHAGALPS